MILILKHSNPDIAHQINELQKESYLLEAKLIKYPSHPNLRQGIADIQNTGEIFLGYYVQKKLIGVISYEIEDSVSLTICRLIVKPSFFGRGIAGKLINAVERHEPGIRIFYVQTAKDNQPAINRYQKSGYRLLDEYNTPDGLLLVKLKKNI